jgi:hypothetical protein
MAAFVRSQGGSFFAYAPSLVFWVRCALYFVAATPFEQDRSGFSYLIRLCCIILLLALMSLIHRTRLQSPHPLAALVFLALVAANIGSPGDRLLISLALIVTTCTLGQICSEKWLEELGHILGVYLAVNAVGLVLQIVALIGAGTLLDLHGMIFPNAARIEFLGEYGRLSGFHNEPGTYSQWMLMTLFLRSLITRKLLTLFNLVVCGTIAATVSLWGILAVCVYLLAATIELLIASKTTRAAKRIGISALFALTVATTATLFSDYITHDSIAFLQNKAGLTTDSGEDKIVAMADLEQQFQHVIFIGAPITPGFCPPCLAPNDIGIWANGIYYFGFMLMFALVATLALRLGRHWGLQFVPLLAMMLSWKAPFYDPSLWMLIGHILGRKLMNRG